jgi:hypothetical protein
MTDPKVLGALEAILTMLCEVDIAACEESRAWELSEERLLIIDTMADIAGVLGKHDHLDA